MNSSLHYTLRPFTAGPFARLAACSGRDDSEPNIMLGHAEGGTTRREDAPAPMRSVGGVTVPFGESVSVDFAAYKRPLVS